MMVPSLVQIATACPLVSTATSGLNESLLVSETVPGANHCGAALADAENAKTIETAGSNEYPPTFTQNLTTPFLLRSSDRPYPLGPPYAHNSRRDRVSVSRHMGGIFEKGGLRGKISNPLRQRID